MNKICLLLCCLLPGLFRARAQELKMTEYAPVTQIYGEVCESCLLYTSPSPRDA